MVCLNNDVNKTVKYRCFCGVSTPISPICVTPKRQNKGFCVILTWLGATSRHLKSELSACVFTLPNSAKALQAVTCGGASVHQTGPTQQLYELQLLPLTLRALMHDAPPQRLDRDH